MTFDDDNPLLGEVPDVPARSGVAAVLGAADRVAGAVQAVAEIRELHMRTMEGSFTVCRFCRMEYPCPTVRVLERHSL